MALRATCVDDRNKTHLLIGLNRENIEALMGGEVLALPTGQSVRLGKSSQILIVFAETDDELVEHRLPSDPNRTPSS